jgi:hypothetical protein
LRRDADRSARENRSVGTHFEIALARSFRSGGRIRRDQKITFVGFRSETQTHALDYPKKTKVYGPWVIAGSAGIDASMKGDLAKGKVKGSVKIKGLSVEIAESMLDVKDANLDFPFDYDFGYRPSGKTRLAVGKESFFDSGLFRDRENLTIGSIASKHPRANVVRVPQRPQGHAFLQGQQSGDSGAESLDSRRNVIRKGHLFLPV